MWVWYICVLVSMFVVVCFICLYVQSCVVLSVDKRLDCEKYLVSCELHGSFVADGWGTVRFHWDEMARQGHKG